MATTFQNSAVVRDADAHVIAGAEVIWQSLQPAVATVDSTGLIEAVSAGTAIIVASSGGVSTPVRVVVEA